MGSSMTLGKRISIGFGILVFIMVVLGAIGVINMRSASSNATKLSDIYVPEVSLSSHIFELANQIRYDMRGYVYREDDASLTSAKKNFVELKNVLAQAEELGKKYNLTGLLENAKVASKGLAEYMNSSERIEKALIKRKVLDGVMAEASASFLKNTEQYLGIQEKKLKNEMEEKVSTTRLFERYEKIRQMHDVIEIITYSRIFGQRAQIQGDTEMIAGAIQKFVPLYKLLEQMKATSTNAEELADLKVIEAAAKTYENSLKGFEAIMHEVAKEAAVLVRVAVEVLNAAEAVVDTGLRDVENISHESTQSLSVASNVMIVGLVIALVLGIVIALYIIRSIVNIVTNSVKSLSEGTTQVVSASEQISSASVSLAEGASSQASSVEEVSATIEEATASNNQNADNSREANLLAQHSNDAARQGNEQMADLMVAMEKITDSSQKIAKIIKTIDEIAFQTNLLALNAAVEAARAGEHGLGFAVVAEEVKNLAERSANAAKEITSIIEASIDQVKVGTEVASRTKASFGEILSSIKKTSDLIGEIAISAKEQAEGMNQIATAMGSVDQITQQNASASEETAAAAEELNAQAISMLESVAEIAALAGYDMGKERSVSKVNHTASKSVSSLSMPPKRLTMSSNKKMKAPTSSIKNNEEVFPLNEDDLKEF
ncbi:HAMP domain-containing methyl-accepting chemotaxis protein [Sulfurospirillum barnesii]|uniref:Methyl-accepting chemotaxis protein n=1 Tax=Sulfurospirillum barnesii (strain ATCC 700032 / DSM 10660 / SES-3) TaxID=760154 RepID=I3XZL1_SULBS|nr:methyl-accepting chemotaxis protein [Sulfurospirillum barnesii]AFL69385.1 methyl-accepting chemotaxis protein [Sulfurospirillum barnesii SES-3]